MAVFKYGDLDRALAPKRPLLLDLSRLTVVSLFLLVYSIASLLLDCILLAFDLIKGDREDAFKLDRFC